MSDPKILPDVTNDEVDTEPDLYRDDEIKRDRPPHYE